MLINIIIDFANICLIIWLIFYLRTNIHKYQNGLKQLRKVILVGTCFFLLSTMVLMFNSIFNYIGTYEHDYIISFIPVRIFCRLVILFCLGIYIGICKNMYFEFISVSYWKNKIFKQKDKL